MQKWEYEALSVYSRTEGKREDEMTTWYIGLSDEDEQMLSLGLDLQGKQGWELVGIQATHLRAGELLGETTDGWYYPQHLYVFKSPIEE